MNAFQWNPCFQTGIAEVDEQHRHLVDVINRFGELVMRESGVDPIEIEVVFAELAAYARYHFSEEEALMADQLIDARTIERHHEAHRSFMTDVHRLHESVKTGDTSSARRLLEFLTHWLAYHILGTDQEMARLILNKEAGTRLAATLNSNKESTDPATEALLSALNALFQQVSERNRELVQLNSSLEARVAERTQALLEANQRLEDLANTDLLTGLPNRRYAMRSLADAWESSTQRGTAMSCLVIDADGFKGVNDTYGHDVGDSVLRNLSACLRRAIRTDDVVCRMGGDEFLVICADTPTDGAMKLAEKMRRNVSEVRVAVGEGTWQASISVGVAARKPAMSGIEDLLKAADMALYQAKQRGRNAVAGNF